MDLTEEDLNSASVRYKNLIEKDLTEFNRALEHMGIAPLAH
jgi:hypothetical protein